VRERSLDEIWNDPEYLAYRERLHNFVFAPCTFCGGCDLSETNEEDCLGNDIFPVCGGVCGRRGLFSARSVISLEKGDFCYTVFMQARFYANMRTVVETSSAGRDVREVGTLRELIAFLVASYPDAKFHLLDEQGSLRPDVPVYVDGVIRVC